jgi:hypothetical protein
MLWPTITTPGNVADVVTAVPLLGHHKTKAPARGQGLRRRQSAPIADAKEDRSGLSAAARRTPYPLDRAAYKRRNVVKRMFCKLKNWRRVATRYAA